ncbi:hypothetical protein GGD57_002377 [Rhizobium esperanzae]|uniref:PspA/IM30 family protein n=1 Tax=Rhizobium esperanzae TaxID=1967781 RepID=A0A7W6R2T5_9HYPH|nr:hypothetical protein [Rhizobium esperanzae]
MLKRFFEKWRELEEALDGIDDLQGQAFLNLERRVARLEKELASLRAIPPLEN